MPLAWLFVAGVAFWTVVALVLWLVLR